GYGSDRLIMSLERFCGILTPGAEHSQSGLFRASEYAVVERDDPDLVPLQQHRHAISREFCECRLEVPEHPSVRLGRVGVRVQDETDKARSKLRGSIHSPVGG